VGVGAGVAVGSAVGISVGGAVVAVGNAGRSPPVQADIRVSEKMIVALRVNEFLFIILLFLTI